ncbi:MAG: hypothetical protein E6Q97_37580 [Desulfurellales bacterium]|nr:MAG: hypothetical protein E6Q97_37580 [Desulfurellales bacterium]
MSTFKPGTWASQDAYDDIKTMSYVQEDCAQALRCMELVPVLYEALIRSHDIFYGEHVPCEHESTGGKTNRFCHGCALTVAQAALALAEGKE